MSEGLIPREPWCACQGCHVGRVGYSEYCSPPNPSRARPLGRPHCISWVRLLVHTEIWFVYFLFCFVSYTQDAKIGQAPSSDLFSWLKWLWLRCSGKESMVAWVGWEGWLPSPSPRALTSFFPFLGLYQSLAFWMSSSSESPPPPALLHLDLPWLVLIWH